MKNKVTYIIPRQENVKLYDFTANRFLFKTLKSCGIDGLFCMNVTSILLFQDEDINCSPISLGG